VKAVASLCTIAVATLVSGCSPGAEKTSRSVGRGDAGRHYALLADDRFELQEALDPPAGDPLTSIERPLLDWYAEYVRSSETSSQMVRISGHQTTFDQSRVQLEDKGFQFRDVTVEGWRAIGGSIPGDSPGEAVLVLENGESSLAVLSYELTLDDLVALAAKIEPASAARWVRAGGVIR
jgi:hypothetical protein